MTPPPTPSNPPEAETAQPRIDYCAVEESPPFLELKHRHRRFVFPVAALFLAWYFGYVLLAAFAPEFVATPVWGLVNVGLLLGLSQFVTTFAITTAYVMFANRRLDPLAASMRTELENQEAAS